VLKVVVGAVVLTVVLLGLMGLTVVVASWYLLTGGVATVAAPAIGSQLARAGGWAALNPPVAPSGAPGTRVPGGVPAEQWAVMQQVAASSSCHVSAADLAAMAKIESGFGANMATSSAGAIGYGQFLPSTWAAYGAGGDPYDFHAALPAMARYLCSLGYASDRRQALNRYGGCLSATCLGTTDYASQVDRLASTFGVQPAATASGAVETALQWLGTPYLWGGNTPGVGLDCSGLVQQALAAVGVRVPRTSEQQYAASQRIDASQVRSGDLVFFSSDGPGATHVGLVVAPGQMVDAPTDGIPVRVESFLTPYWQGVLYGYGRVG
jgi:cell wall-associated NlpC family hydrolase